MRKKKGQLSSSSKELSRNITWEEVLHPQAYCFHPGKDEWRARLIFTLFKWVEEPDSLEIEQFCFTYKIYRELLWQWCGQWPDIKQAVTEVKLRLASKRRIGVVKRQYDREMVCKDLHKYDAEWVEINKYWSDMKKTEEEVSKTFNIHMTPAPITGQVKPRIKKEGVARVVDESV